jgi:hypothetical protein
VAVAEARHYESSIRINVLVSRQAFAVAVSLPELLMLKQVMRTPLLMLFVTFLLALFTLLGWLFNALPFAL